MSNPTNNKKFKRTSKKGPKSKPFKKEDREEIMKDRPGKNDITWYGSDVLINAAGRHNFTNPLGKSIGWEFDNHGSCALSQATDPAAPWAVPGVMSINIDSGIGFCDSAVSPGNVFMRNFYSYVRHANAGHANYMAPDLGMYVMAVDQIHVMIEHLVRIYGVARTYSSMNRYAPDAFLYAMGVDPHANNDALYTHLATMRSNILNLMVKAGTLLVPNDMKFIERHKGLMRFIYADGSTSKTQTYVFRPQGYKIYRETGTAHEGGYLEFVNMEGFHPIGDWIVAANSMIDAVVQSEDMNIMSGDILKAYGRENCYQFAAFSEDYTVVPVYNPEILLEIHNAVPVGAPDDKEPYLMDIYQEPSLNIIKYTPKFRSYIPYQNISPIIDMPVEVPSPEQVMIATRLTTMGSVGFDPTHTGWKYVYVPDSMGSEVVTTIVIYTYEMDNNAWTIKAHRLIGAVDTGVDFEARLICMLGNFNWSMGLKVVRKTDDTNWQLVQYFGQLENYTVFNEGDLQKLHDTALVGEFAVPLLGVVGFKTNTLDKPN